MMSKQKIYFRADASAQIGYGHFIRSLALADMLKEDFDCTFFTQSPSEYQQKELEMVCSFISLPSDDSKFDFFLRYLTGEEIVVLDNYFYEYAYQQRIKEKGCKLVCIDDMHKYPFCSDVIICPDPCTQEDFIREEYTKLYCGIEWSLLRKPIIDKANSNKAETNDIVVAFGGADPYHLTQKYVNKLLIETDSKINVIVGDKTIFQCEDERVTIYRKLSAEGIACLFSRAGVAILSTSTICTEALCIGCPIIAGYYIDNQIEYYNYLVNNHFIIPIGNLLNDDEVCSISNAIRNAKVNTQKGTIDFIQQREYIKDLFLTL